MYFYVDESGQTGQNLFDKTQPFLYYGVLSSRVNLDLLAEKYVKAMRNRFSVNRLHARQLGNERLVNIQKEMRFLKKKFDLKFDFYSVAKEDHAIICFFDQTFDAGLNPAVPWIACNTPLKYILLFQLANLFDEELSKLAWQARIATNNTESINKLVKVCSAIIGRVNSLPDRRSRELITDGLKWVIANPSEIGYNVDTKDEALQVSANLIGFQSVLHGIAARLEKSKAKAAAIIVDKQSQFNAAQEVITDFYQQNRHGPWVTGPGLPEMNLQHMPSVPITCTPGTDSAGLELVDIYIWVFKRDAELKELAPGLYDLIQDQRHRGQRDEVSINALIQRWGAWFKKLPQPTEEQTKAAQEICELERARRKQHIEKLLNGAD